MLLYRLKVTVSLLLALTSPVTVALSAIELPTTARGRLLAGADRGRVGVMVTGSAAVPLVTVAVVAVAVVGRHPVVRARGGGRVARRA